MFKFENVKLVQSEFHYQKSGMLYNLEIRAIIEKAIIF